MDKKQFAVFASALKTYYPRENLLPNDKAMELWFYQLQDIDYLTAEAILNQWVSTHRWSPSIADMRELAANMKGCEVSDWGSGWEQVMRAIRKYGYCQIDEAMQSFDDVTRQCVARIGFQNICMSEDIVADRANFRMLYEQISERVKHERQMPEHIRIMVDRAKQNLIEGRTE